MNIPLLLVCFVCVFVAGLIIGSVMNDNSEYEKELNEALERKDDIINRCNDNVNRYMKLTEQYQTDFDKHNKDFAKMMEDIEVKNKVIEGIARTDFELIPKYYLEYVAKQK